MLLFPFLCSPCKTLTLLETVVYSFLLRLCNSNCGHSLMAGVHEPLSVASVPPGSRNSWLGHSFSMHATSHMHHKVTLLGLRATHKIVFPSNYDSIYFLNSSFCKIINSSWIQPKQNCSIFTDHTPWALPSTSTVPST